MLGTDLVDELESRGHTVTGVDRDELDITDPEAVAGLANGSLGEFDVCFNCAAYTAVDQAESDFDTALLLNGIAVGYVARACAAQGIPLLHVSTDFVFDGQGTRPYLESDPIHPEGAYARSKAAGEEAALAGNPQTSIVRTAWLFGPNGGSFPRTMVRAHRAGKPLKVVADQIGNPTYTGDLARTLVDLALAQAEPGIYHATGPDTMTWRDFAEATLRVYEERIGGGKPPKVAPIRTADWPTPAKRPAYSVLSNEKLQRAGVAPMRPMSEAIPEFLDRLLAREPNL